MRRIANGAVIAIGALVLLAMLLAGLVATVEFRIPLDGQRERIAQALTEALGLPVALSGPLQVITGPDPGVDAQGVRVGDDGAPVAASIARLTARLQLWPLWRHEIRVTEATADDARVCLRPAGAPATPARTAPMSDWRLVEITRFGLRQWRIDAAADCRVDGRVDGSARGGLLDITQLDLQAPQGSTLHLSAQGRLNGEDARVELHGPALATLFGAAARAQPFDLAARWAGASLALRGEVDIASRTGQANAEFGTAEMAPLLQALSVPMHNLGPLKLRAHVAATGSTLRLQLHEFALRPLAGSADAQVDWSGPRPAYRLDATAGRLDTKVLNDWWTNANGAATADTAEPGGFARRAVEALRDSDGELTVAIGQLAAGPLALSGAALNGAWHRGELDGTAQAAWERSAIAGTWRADLRHDAFTYTVTAGMKRFLLPPALGIEGRLETVDATFDGRGGLGQRAPNDFRASLAIRGARLEVPSGGKDRSTLTLDRVQAQWRARDTAVVDASGTFAGERIRLHVAGDDATALWQRRPWQLAAQGQAGPMALQAQGTLALRGDRTEASLNITAHADRLGSLARGQVALGALPLDAQSTASIVQGNWHVDLQRLRIGRTRASAQVHGRLTGAPEPLQAQLRFDRLDLTELSSAPPAATTAAPRLPQRLALPAADIDLRAAQVVLPGASLDDLGARLLLRGGRLMPSTFGFGLAGARIDGTAAADLTGAAAALSAQVRATGLSERPFASWLADRGLKFQIGELSLAATTTGNDASELLGHAQAQLDLRRARITLPGVDGSRQRTANITSAALRAAPGQASTAVVTGDLEGLPVELSASTAALPGLLPPAAAPIRVDARLADVDVTIQGLLGHPQDHSGDTEPAAQPFKIGIRAPTLDAFEAFTPLDLPSTGPVALDLTLTGQVSDSPAADFTLTLGQSALTGHLSRQAVGERWRWQADLASPRLRLEDLGAAGWIRQSSPAEPGGKARKPPDVLALAASERRRQQIADEFAAALQRIDGRIHLVVERLSAGTEDFGHVEATASLDSGRLRIAPVAIVGPGGNLTLSGETDLAATDRPFRFDLTLEHVDYGRLAQSIDPSQGASGELSLHLQLAGQGRSDERLPSLNGKLGLIVFPSSSRALKALDLWGGGLLRNLGTTLEPGQGKHVNCGVATFDIGRGRLESQALMLDTERIRVAGRLSVDLSQGTLDGLLMPKSKRAELFSSQLPMSIGGTLAKPAITPAAGGLLIASARYFLFAYTYLYDTATGGDLPADGRADCAAVYDRLVTPR